MKSRNKTKDMKNKEESRKVTERKGGRKRRDVVE